jgi:hypothetical protein
MWNILSLNRTAAFRKLKDELCKYRIAVAAVQEFRWCGSEIFILVILQYAAVEIKSSHSLEKVL